jgi:hypothetical protein
MFSPGDISKVQAPNARAELRIAERGKDFLMWFIVPPEPIIGTQASDCK